MKALEFLKQERAHYLAMYNDKSIIKQYDEAIEELKTLTTSTTPQQTTQSKFKVGDWVVYTGGGYCDGEILQITKIDEKGFCTFGSYNKLYHFNKLRRWKPKPDEWCWVYNVTREVPYLRKVIRVEANYKNRFNDYEFTKAVRVSRGDTSGEVGYRFCEPFIGVVPSTIEQY